MTARTSVYRLQVATPLYQFIDQQVLPGTGISSVTFWRGFDALVSELAPQNLALLAERDRLQTALDQWHSAHPGPISDMPAYQAFLTQIGYLVPVPAKVQVTTAHVDAELATQAGPQLVVPILNARYALNAANARWGSLYDALYGTDVISEAQGCAKGPGYNEKRGAKVIEYSRYVLDRTAPLKSGSHLASTGYKVVKGALQVSLQGGKTSGLTEPKQFVGYQGEASHPSSVLLVHHGLHLDIQINPQHPIGASDPAGVSDLVVEAALSTILDLEDSVAAVDAEDKLLAYSNWLGILKGTLTEDVSKGGSTFKHHTAWPCVVVLAQCGSLDDQPGHLVPRRRRADARDPRGHHGCHGDHHHRLARPARPRRQRYSQFPHRFGLHRQAQNARSRRSGLCFGIVQPC